MKQKRCTANVFHRESEIMIFISITLPIYIYADPLGFLVFYNTYSIYMPTVRLRITLLASGRRGKLNYMVMTHPSLSSGIEGQSGGNVCQA